MNKIILIVTVLVLCPSSISWGTVGIAESHSELHYNDYAMVHWIHPGDGCDVGKYCFQLHRKDKYGSFNGLYFSIDKISVPKDVKSEFILGQRSIDHFWFVYDLRNEKLVIQAPDYSSAFAIWKSLGQQGPKLTDAETGRYLHETLASVVNRWLFILLMFSPLIGLAFVVGLVFLSIWCWSRFQSTKHQLYLLLFAGTLLPVLVIATYVIYVLFPVVFHMVFQGAA